MGYDMYHAHVPAEDKAKAEELRKQAHNLYAQRNALPPTEVPGRAADGWNFDPDTGSAEWWRLHKEAEAASNESEQLRGYYRLNIWDMGRAREAMCAYGMLDTNRRPANLTFPRREDFGLEDWPDDDEDFGLEDWPDDDEEHDPESPEAKFLAARDAYLGAEIEGGLIPAYKLGSNGGWIVTPNEIRNSFNARTDEPEPGVEIPPWFDDWLRYLAGAMGRGGFKVY